MPLLTYTPSQQSTATKQPLIAARHSYSTIVEFQQYNVNYNESYKGGFSDWKSKLSPTLFQSSARNAGQNAGLEQNKKSLSAFWFFF